ncbi:MAG: hypothetical protein QOG00_1350 [Pyrinomonadaceae bacterium]|nr:hypothetical protein [Pyrinomonadaceae bacterium]
MLHAIGMSERYFMNDDEQMAVIGRMVTERKRLWEKEAALAEEAKRIGEGLKRLGHKVAAFNSPYSAETGQLTPEQAELLNAEKIVNLINDLTETRARIKEITERLN